MRLSVGLSILLALVACRRTPTPSGRDGGATGDAQGPSLPTIPRGETQRFTGDLAAIVQRQTLRFIVQGEAEGFLPRDGHPRMDDIKNAERFAASIGVEPQFVLVDGHDELMAALELGDGDVIATPFTITADREKRVAFLRSSLGVEEVVVGRKATNPPLADPKNLAGRTVFVRLSSAYRRSLEALEKKLKVDIDIQAAPEDLDTETIVEMVTQSPGERLTVVDSHLLRAFETYNPDIARVLTLPVKRRIAWAVRKKSPQLRAALDRFVIEEAMRLDAGRSTADLATIRKRGTLRVLTRNNATSYFLYRGREFGFEYELAKHLAASLELRLQMIVVPNRAALLPWLQEGRGDLVAAQLTRTEARAERVRFSRPYLTTTEVVVRKVGTTEPATVEALDGRVVHVRRSSSYAATLSALAARGIRPKIEPVDEALETEAILARVADGTWALTVADRQLLDVERTYGLDVEAAFPVAEERPLALAMRADNPKLAAAVDAFLDDNVRGRDFNVARRRYFEDPRQIARFKVQRVAASQKISPYDDLLKKYAERYKLDWRLMAAQAYVESRFDPNAKSWVGALGLFQVMPRTGASMGLTRLEDPEVGVHAGMKYMARLLSRFDPTLPLEERMRMAFAAYNAGLGHVYDARRLARRLGLNPNVWFDNVEKAMLLLADPKYARRARHGYCRGGQPVAYVRHIQRLYDAYVSVTP